MITKIRVPARFTQCYDDGESHPIKAVAEFTLGLGPCGKVVDSLHCGWNGRNENIFWVRQIHVDGTHKMFYYRHADLIGRIEIEES